MLKKCWIFGLVSACALATSNVPDMSAPFYPILRAIAAIFAVLAGYHYPGPPASTGKVPIEVAALAIGLCMLAAGCRVADMGIGLNVPPFGSLSVSVGGGVIGHASKLESSSRTNLAPLAALPIGDGTALLSPQ
jgi:hypothetical protein